MWHPFWVLFPYYVIKSYVGVYGVTRLTYRKKISLILSPTSTIHYFLRYHILWNFLIILCLCVTWWELYFRYLRYLFHHSYTHCSPYTSIAGLLATNTLSIRGKSWYWSTNTISCSNCSSSYITWTWRSNSIILILNMLVF